MPRSRKITALPSRILKRRGSSSSGDGNGNDWRSKREIFEDYMTGDFTLVHLDSRRSGVELPAHLMGQSSVTLKLSYRFQGETTHDDLGVVAYLKFSGEYVRCSLPWSAIWGMSAEDNRRTIWPDDLPKELILELARNRLSELAARLFGQRNPPETAPANEKKEGGQRELVTGEERRADSRSKGGKTKTTLKRIK